MRPPKHEKYDSWQRKTDKCLCLLTEFKHLNIFQACSVTNERPGPSEHIFSKAWADRFGLKKKKVYPGCP